MEERRLLGTSPRSCDSSGKSVIPKSLRIGILTQRTRFSMLLKKHNFSWEAILETQPANPMYDHVSLAVGAVVCQVDG